MSPIPSNGNVNIISAFVSHLIQRIQSCYILAYCIYLHERLATRMTGNPSIGNTIVEDKLLLSWE